MNDAKSLLISIARSFVGTVEEGGDNMGKMVEEFQKAVDGKACGEPWCMCFVQFCIKQVEQTMALRSNIYRSESCLETWEKSPPLLRRTKPEPGAIAIFNRFGTRLGHTGIVTSVRSPEVYATVEGNTTDGKDIEREGDGVFEKYRSIRPTGVFRTLGWIQPF